MKVKVVPKKVFTLDDVGSEEKSHQICIVLRDVPGALAKAAKVLANANINVKTSSTFYLAEYPNAGVWALWSGFERILHHSGLAAVLYPNSKKR